MEKFFSGLFLLLTGLVSAPVLSDTVKQLTSFSEEAVVMRDHKMPMLVLFTQEDCHHCESIKSEFLQPMQLSGDYESRVLLRQLPMDSYDSVVDSEGKSTTARELSKRYDVDFSPTVLLLDENGKPLTEPLIGYSGADYYGFYLEKRIAAAEAESSKR